MTIERPFDIQLDKLKTKIIKMCSLVDEQVQYAIKSVEEENRELAEYVIDRDEKVNKYDVKIEKICQKLIALNQPVAHDLRMIMSALKINSNVERLGDLAVNISWNAIDLERKPEFFDRLNFAITAQLTMDMINKSIDAFINNDSELAKSVLIDEDKLDDIVKENSELIVTIMEENPEFVRPGLLVYNIFQELERLGDHATNICEEVYFIVTAQLLKHRFE